MRNARLLPLLLALAAAPSALAAPAAKPPITSPRAVPDWRPPKTVTRTDDDSGKPVSLNAGDTLVVRLQANATTGYQWEVATKLPPYLTLKSSRYTTDPHPPHMVGVGGVQEFRFYAPRNNDAAEIARRVDLRLIYRRPFEPRTKAPAQTWQAPVTVVQHEKFVPTSSKPPRR